MNNKLSIFISNNLFIGIAYHLLYLNGGQNTYISIILGTLLGILNIYIINKLNNSSNNNIIFKTLFVLFNLYIMLLTLTIIPLFVNYFYLVNSPKWLIIIPLLAVSMYTASKGKKVLCKLSNILFIFNIFLIFMTFILLMRYFKLENIENFLAYIWYFNYIITLSVNNLNIKETINNKVLYYILIIFIYYISIYIFGENYSYCKFIYETFPIISYSFLFIIIIYIILNKMRK